MTTLTLYMSLSMTKIFKFQDDIDVDTLKKLEKCESLAIDTEGSGLQFHIEIS